MKKTEVFQNDLEKLKKEVGEHRGSMTRIAEEAGVSITFVRLCLDGYRWSKKVIDAAAKVLPEMKAEKSKRDSKEQQEIKAIFQKALA